VCPYGHQGPYTQSHGVSVSCLICDSEAGGIGGVGVADDTTASRFPHQRRTRCTGVCTCARRRASCMGASPPVNRLLTNVRVEVVWCVCNMHSASQTASTNERIAYEAIHQLTAQRYRVCKYTSMNIEIRTKWRYDRASV